MPVPKLCKPTSKAAPSESQALSKKAPECTVPVPTSSSARPKKVHESKNMANQPKDLKPVPPWRRPPKEAESERLPEEEVNAVGGGDRCHVLGCQESTYTACPSNVAIGILRNTIVSLAALCARRDREHLAIEMRRCKEVETRTPYA